MFIESDGGRSNSKRPKQQNDCVIRAIAIAFNLKYDDVYDIFAEMGRKCSSKTAKTLAHPWLNERCKRIMFPAVKGIPRMNLGQFCLEHREGTYIVQMAKHLSVVKDGNCYDDKYPRFKACVYGVWELP